MVIKRFGVSLTSGAAVSALRFAIAVSDGLMQGDAGFAKSREPFEQVMR